MPADSEAPDVLKAACDAVIVAPDLQPTRDKKGNITATHCNQAVRRVAQALGYHDFDDLALTADLMCAIMASTPSCWKKVDGFSAAAAAIMGQLAVACMTSQQLGEEHGHVAVVYPTRTDRSPSLGKDVPSVANVGKKCGIVLSSAAFPVAKGEAYYFVRDV